MSPAREPIRLAQLMVLMAIAAGSLAVLVSLPWEARVFPTFWVFLGVVDYVAAWKLVLRRPLRASHYVFLIAFLIGAIILWTQVAMDRFRPLTVLLQVLRPGVSVAVIPFLGGDFAEFWAATTLAILPAGALGHLAGRLERRRGWDIAAICRGMLTGFAVASLFGVIQHATLGPERESIVANWVALGVFVPLFGWIGRSTFPSGYHAPVRHAGA